MPRLRAVFFDVDGVLLDSLPQHLAFCKLKAEEYGLHLHTPSIEEFKSMVTHGVPVSPMLKFFLAVGFPDHFAHRAVREYEREFATLFPPKPFDGVGTMLSTLRRADIYLGLVTANIRENVEPPLRDFMHFFDPRCLFFFDRSAPKDKRASLLTGAAVLDVPPRVCAFVGDQPADGTAARSAHFYFLGVSYGWGFSAPHRALTIVGRVEEIAPALLSLCEN